MEEAKKNTQSNKDYLSQLNKQVDELEFNVQFFQNAFKNTFIIGYTEKDNAKDNYDRRIIIDSLDKIAEGWKIITNNLHIPTSPQRIISFIGNKSKGKTFAFNLLTSKTNVENTNPTEGLCIKTLMGCKTFLDIPGSNSLNFLNESSDEMKTKGLTSKFLEQFLVQVSDIIIFVVGRMTVQDIQFYKAMKYLKHKTIIVLHNMSMITQEKPYNDFDNTIREYGFDITQVKGSFNYYIEKMPDYDNHTQMVHVMLANHHSMFYQKNLEVISSIQAFIDQSKTQRMFNIVEELKWFTVDNSWKYFGQAITGKEILITSNEIKLERKTLAIKPCISYFATDIVTHKIDPSYHYFYTNQSFVLQIELSNECQELHSNVQVVNDKYVFQIYGVKHEVKPDPNYKDNEANVSLFQFGEFLLRIAVPISSGLLSDSRPAVRYQDGLLHLTYPLQKEKAWSSKDIIKEKNNNNSN